MQSHADLVGCIKAIYSAFKVCMFMSMILFSKPLRTLVYTLLKVN